MALISSPAAPASSGRTWPKSSSAAASACASSTASSPASARTSRTCRRSSSSRATSPTSTSRARAVDGRGLRAAPGGDPVGAAVGQRPDHLESRQHRRHAQRARRGARRGRQARRLRRLVVGLRQHADAAQARGDADRRRCRPTRCRSWWASSTGRCSRSLYGLETVTIRYFNVFGPRQDPSSPYSGVISLFISALLEGRAADHLRRRRADARLHLRRQRRRRRAARLPRAGPGRRGDQRRHRRADQPQPTCWPTLGDLVGRRAEAIYQDERAGDVHDSQADIEKAQRLTGYLPTVSLEEGLARTLAWYRAEQGAGGAAL